MTEPFAPGVSFAYALIADEKGSDCHDHGERVLMAAKVIVTAERFLMAAILIVEDDVFIREIAELMIQDWGHQTLSAKDHCASTEIAFALHDRKFHDRQNESSVC